MTRRRGIWGLERAKMGDSENLCPSLEDDKTHPAYQYNPWVECPVDGKSFHSREVTGRRKTLRSQGVWNRREDWGLHQERCND